MIRTRKQGITRKNKHMSTGQKRGARLGQHFLTSPGALSDMVESGDIHAGDIVLEIGPGKGVLTEKLLEKMKITGRGEDTEAAGKVIAIEKDLVLIDFLQTKFAKEISEGSLVLIAGDILTLADAVPNEQPYKIIANIPYYITGEIIRLFLTHPHKPESMTLLVQKEVAERIVARDEKESVLSLSVKVFGTPRYVSTVKRGSFNPPPRVDSAIIHIANISQPKPLTGKFDEKSFFMLVKAGFHSKRKKVLSNIATLASEDKRYDKERVLAAFHTLGLDENVRAEDLKLDDWLALLALLTELR